MDSLIQLIPNTLDLECDNGPTRNTSDAGRHSELERQLLSKQVSGWKLSEMSTLLRSFTHCHIAKVWAYKACHLAVNDIETRDSYAPNYSLARGQSITRPY